MDKSNKNLNEYAYTNTATCNKINDKYEGLTDQIKFIHLYYNIYGSIYV
jgi:hypothetical protein